MAFIAQKRIETAKFILEPGMAVPPHFTAGWIIRHLKKEYGEDAIVWQDYTGENSSAATVELSKIKIENDRLGLENRQLKARLAALDKTSRQAA